MIVTEEPEARSSFYENLRTKSLKEFDEVLSEYRELKTRLKN